MIRKIADFAQSPIGDNFAYLLNHRVKPERAGGGYKYVLPALLNGFDFRQNHTGLHKNRLSIFNGKVSTDFVTVRRQRDYYSLQIRRSKFFNVVYYVNAVLIYGLPASVCPDINAKNILFLYA